MTPNLKTDLARLIDPRTFSTTVPQYNSPTSVMLQLPFYSTIKNHTTLIKIITTTYLFLRLLTITILPLTAKHNYDLRVPGTAFHVLNNRRQALIHSYRYNISRSKSPRSRTSFLRLFESKMKMQNHNPVFA
jgi:hypothetical protein